MHATSAPKEDIIKSLVFTLLLVGIILSLHPSHTYAWSWESDTIDTGADIGFAGDLAVDPSGNYITSYFDRDLEHLIFARSTDRGENWTTVNVDTSPGWTLGTRTSITSDSAGHYFITYYDTVSEILRCARSLDGGTSWSSGTIDSSGDVGFHSSITVDLSDNLIVSYVDSTNSTLKFAKSLNSGLSWTTLIVQDQDSDGGEHSSIYTNGQGDYIIVYDYYKSGGFLVTKGIGFATSTDNGSSWENTLVYSIESMFEDYLYVEPSFAYDSQGRYFVSFSEMDVHSWPISEDLYFSKSDDDGQTWDTTDLSISSSSVISSIIVDHFDNLLLTYIDQTSYPMFGTFDYILGNLYSEDQGNIWENENLIVEADVDVGSGGTLTSVVDESNTYLISFNNLRYEEYQLYSLITDESPPNIASNQQSFEFHQGNEWTFRGNASDNLTEVSAVAFQIDTTSGSWTPCTPDDGAFDEMEEDFSCVIPSDLDIGEHTIYIRSMDLFGNATSPEMYDEYPFTVLESLAETGEGILEYYVVSSLIIALFVSTNCARRKFT